MINLMERKNNLKTPETIISLIPILISSGIAIILFIFYVIPQYVNSNKVNLELNELIKKKNKLNNLKTQYKIINKKFEKLNLEKTKIIELFTGNANLDTLLDKLGEIGIRNNIEFVSIVPLELVNHGEISKENNN